MSTTNNTRGSELKQKQKQREIESQRKIANAYKVKMAKMKEEHEKALKNVVITKEQEAQNKKQEKSERIKDILLYVGTVSAIVAGVAYGGVTWTIINGFENALDRDKQLLFAAISAAFGIVISMLLRSQGVSLAKRLPASQTAMKDYYTALNKTKTLKKLRTIKYYMTINTIKDMITKALTIGITTYAIIYMFSEGNGDFALFTLALSNVCMFAGFGLVALSKTYDFYIEQHIPAIIERTKKIKDQMGLVPSEGEKDVNIQQPELQKDATTSSKKS